MVRAKSERLDLGWFSSGSDEILHGVGEHANTTAHTHTHGREPSKTLSLVSKDARCWHSACFCITDISTCDHGESSVCG